MVRYVEVLDAVKSLTLFSSVTFGIPEEGKWRTNLPPWLRKVLRLIIGPHKTAQPSSPFAIRPLVQLFVEAHIRKKLKAIAEAYLAIRARSNSGSIELREWTKENGEICEKLAGTLGTWASVEGAVKLLWPFAVGALTAWLGVKDIWEAFRKYDFDTYLLVGVILFFPALYFLIFMSASFSYKRMMFIPGFDTWEVPYDRETPASTGTNIYILEDNLFSLLHRKKVGEKSWDVFFIVSCFVLFAGVPVLTDLKNPILWGTSSFFLIMAIILLVKGRNRKWH